MFEMPYAHKVLIIDDEYDICFLLGQMLHRRDYEVIFANTLTDGLARLILIKPSLLFLDVQLPDGSGLDVLNKIRTENPKVKIVVMSANDGRNERKRAIENGADLFISKPINKEAINKTLSII
jgi:DNA-binding response OmpR family regulator